MVAKIDKLLENNQAIANLRNVRKKINIGLIEGQLKEGDWVLIHTGFAISKIDEEKAMEILAAYDEADKMDTQIF